MQRMLPADQSLQPDHASAGHFHLRLILANELRAFALYCLDQLDTQLHFARGALVANRVEKS